MVTVTTTIMALVIFMRAQNMGAFITVPNGCSSSSKTRRYLKDDVAAMIDDEYYRQHHRTEYDIEWMEKNRDAVLQRLRDVRDLSSTPSSLSSSSLYNEDASEFQQKAKDRRMASLDPQRYCRDRCLSTGNCDVFEDLFHFTPQEAIRFCTECVLGDEHDHCDVPDAMYDFDWSDQQAIDKKSYGNSDRNGKLHP